MSDNPRNVGVAARVAATIGAGFGAGTNAIVLGIVTGVRWAGSGVASESVKAMAFRTIVRLGLFATFWWARSSHLPYRE